LRARFRFHDLRHDLATKVLRESGNLNVTGEPGALAHIVPDPPNAVLGHRIALALHELVGLAPDHLSTVRSATNVKTNRGCSPRSGQRISRIVAVIGTLTCYGESLWSYPSSSWCALGRCYGVSETVIAAVLLLHVRSVDDIAPQLSATDGGRVRTDVGRPRPSGIAVGFEIPQVASLEHFVQSCCRKGLGWFVMLFLFDSDIPKAVTSIGRYAQSGFY
jgi:hypothetical protein